jgi:hypothetical protein
MRRLARAVALLACLALPTAAQTPEAPVPPANPLAPRPADSPADAWAGTYLGQEQGQTLRLTLERRGEGYGGAIELSGQRLPLEATGDAGRLAGSFTSEGARFPFTVTRDGAAVVLESGGATYRLAREAPANPLAQPQGGALAPAPAGAGDVPADWQTYRHALGWLLRYPPGWRLDETEAGLVLTPPDLTRDAAGQPLEVFLVNAIPSGGVPRPDDPRAVQFVDQTLGTTFPFLRRGGAAASEALGGRPTAVLRYAGRNPTGVDIRAVVLVTLIDDHAVVLLGAGQAGKVEAREALLRRVLASAGKGEGQRDARLVGAWRYEHHTFVRDFSSTSIRTLVLRADGTCQTASRTFAGSTQRDSGGDATGSTTVDTGAGSPSRGTWAADGRRLFLRWGDGSTEEWGYEAGGGGLLLKGSCEPRLYEKVN